MLQQVCEHIHNFFVKDHFYGGFTIADGVISPSLPLLDGQRFRIKGSVLSNGVYTYHADGITNDDDTEVVGLQDETFAGMIDAMAVPPAVIGLSGEISNWVAKNAEIVNSPLNSESWGGYSYTKASGNSATGNKPYSWEDVFRSRLNQYRKVHE